MKRLVGVPSLDFVHVEFVKSLVALQARLQADGIRHDVWICSGTLAHVRMMFDVGLNVANADKRPAWY